MEMVIRKQFELEDKLNKLFGILDKMNKPKAEAESPFLDLDQAAAYAKLERGTIYNAIYRGQLRKQPGTRKVVISKADLDTYLTTRRKKR